MMKPNLKWAGKSIQLPEIGLQALHSGETMHAYVWRCIDLRAKAVSSVVWRDADGVAISPDPSVLYAAEASLCVKGAAFILAGESPAECRVLNPNTVEVVANERNGVVGFKQRIGGVVREYSPDELIYVHYWSPKSDVSGIAPWQVAARDEQIAHAVAEFSRRFFEQGALPPLIISPEDGRMTSTDVEAARTAWQRAVQGVRNFWRALFVPTKLKVETLSIPNIEQLALAELDEILLRRIAVAFGVPVSMLTDAANYATAAEHRASFWSETIVPDVAMLASAFAKRYGIEIYPDYERIAALAEQRREQGRYAIELLNAGIATRDEARAMLGLEADQATASWARALEDLERWQRKSERVGELAEFKSHVMPASWANAVKGLVERGRDGFAWARFMKSASPFESREQQKREERMVELLVEALSPFARRVDEIDYDAMAKAIVDVLAPALAETYESAAIAAMLRRGGWSDLERILDLGASWAIQYAGERVKGIVDSTQEAVRNAIARASREGLSIGQVQDILAPWFGERRARTIAITETTAAYSHGVEAAQGILGEAGIKTELVWQTARDERVCPICGPRHNKPRGRGWDDLPPAHPNCRCWVIIR